MTSPSIRSHDLRRRDQYVALHVLIDDISSPYFGAGAGMGIEDAAVIAELLAVAQQYVQ